uniref:Uncharacterized protein n=2 Tax=Pseudo-nitzschia australis TaxID=44445 RepID=A0A7S4ABE3_9STRA|mmetsp:Transcript_24567/g.51939  ORF Transcript_24567/g.51939 Transcript_24567/m.51939 type:complete len:857 (+) Transcript_24567:200-2770(+)
MNEEPTSTASGDGRFNDETQSTRSSNAINDMVSSGETSTISENGNNECGETHGGQEADRINNISSGGNVTVTTKQNKDASTKEVEIRNSNRKPRNHFTRSRIQKSSNSQKINSEEEEPKSNVRLGKTKRSKVKPNLSIDTCATIMAELDSRSYHQSLMQDANAIVQQILQPMSLPWTHKVIPPPRNIPFDIDDMIDVLTADDGSHTPFMNGNFGFGQYETGSLKSSESAILFANSSENYRAAARRSADPGIIQLSTMVLPTTLQSYHTEDISVIRSSPPTSVDADAYLNDDHFIKGETSLRCFEAMQALKKQKIEQARSCVASYEISVKVNSSSSRSSIFTRTGTPELQPYDILEATLPAEVENGRKMRKTKAKIEAEKLGSYDIRHGIPNSQSCKSAKTPVGRTRLVWTSKTPSDQPQRVSFTSLVDGKKLENGAQKRPRNIQVRIKVDGQICGVSKGAGHEEQQGHKENNAGMSLQATLECDQLVQSLLDGKPDKIKGPNFLPPTIECVPDSAGTIHVVCTSPGTFSSSSVRKMLMPAGQRPVPWCTVCWRSTEGGLEVKKCIGCGLLAHIQCCLEPGESRIRSTPTDSGEKEEWKCDVCCYRDNQVRICGAKNASHNKTTTKKSKLPSKYTDLKFESLQTKSQNVDHSKVVDDEIQCAICLLSGGAMSRVYVEDEIFWVHEICRIWTGSNIKVSANLNENQSCALCGANSDLPACFRPRKDNPGEQTSQKIYSTRCVVKCAAVGCHISAHPMCALASSLTSQSMNESNHNKSENKPQNLSRIEKAKKRDTELCSQYTLTFASVRGKNSGVKTTVPIFFCGIHNPAREKSFYGFYPGGKMMDINETLKVPSWKE